MLFLNDTLQKPGDQLSVLLTPEIAIRFVWCPPGTFKLGLPAKTPKVFMPLVPQEEITFTRGFWISSTPFTRNQLSAIHETELGTYEESWDSPLSQLTWEEARTVCHELTDRLRTIQHPNSFPYLSDQEAVNLPTEAQWEYACRAGTDTIWYFGDDSHDLINHAWCNTTYRLPAVGQKLPNPWGIHDLYGMVYEWCHFKNQVVNTPPDYLYVRGGGIQDREDICNSFSRLKQDNLNSDDDLTGIRLVINNLNPD